MTRTTRTLAGLTSAAALILSACSTGATDPASTDTAADAAARPPAAADAFPVTIEHALGETTIEEAPQRVATLGWVDDDIALSLGVAPVGAVAKSWGGNENRSTDWFDAALEEQGAEQPVRYDDTDGAPVDAIAELAPDVILATNSGITEKEYAKLSKIAPVVAYPDFPWVTEWRTSLDMIGDALGLSDRAVEVRAETEQVIEDGKDEYPGLEGTSLAFVHLTPTDLSTIGLYAAADNRVRTMNDFGMVNASIVDEVVDEGQFYGTMSAERAEDVDADVVLSYAETEDDVADLADDPLIGRIPALRSGHVYAEVDKHLGVSITNPSPLSMPYIVEHYLPGVAEVVPAS
ncbi:putative siderophore-binding lipoprotein YfiY precursor [Nocardioides dokdonensis FR1436]|uniref:Putative siderophore-binding lipoprotein YfiY n=1 Tax=Nocardioides dokdonensis FR1436 TaxID=1300347 RepID=A0A1A9GRE2_9ACTN|nr:iron-siderophore ABC transporter substrate-binding protein [Nocardioides dokdonensis]ANH40031.1 putative siderophore-binding lipoprotein YfiY precursor [Nocardioides dokdonensis FR1436]